MSILKFKYDSSNFKYENLNPNASFQNSNIPISHLIILLGVWLTWWLLWLMGHINLFMDENNLKTIQPIGWSFQ
jgi:hypothetical protein